MPLSSLASSIRLSLCIPTYNRAAFLSETLERIAGQLDEAIQPYVEVIVSDNASPDNTQQVLDRMQSLYPQMRLQRYHQSQNLGPDPNIYQAIMLARGEFVFLLSDDDVLLPGAVQKLLDLMREYPDADALTLNIRSFTNSPEEDTELWYCLPADTLITGCDQSLQALSLSHLFMSVMAFRRTLLLNKNYENQFGTRLLPSFVFMDVLAQSRGLVITAQPYLAQNLVNTGGYNFFCVMVTNYQLLMHYAADLGFAPTLLQEFQLKQLKTSVFHFLIRYKMMAERYSFHLPLWDGCRRLVRAYGLHPFLLFPILPLMLTPAPLLRLLWRLYRVVRYGPRRAAAMPGVQGTNL